MFKFMDDNYWRATYMVHIEENEWKLRELIHQAGLKVKYYYCEDSCSEDKTGYSTFLCVTAPTRQQLDLFDRLCNENGIDKTFLENAAWTLKWE